MTNINFTTLTLQDALDLAILIENEAAERYQELADQMEKHHTPDAARFFLTMVGYETKHRDDLSARRRELFGTTPSVVDSSMLWEVEAPEYDKVRAFMTQRQALLVALDSEKKAHQFFVDAIPTLRDEQARALFEELRDEEVTHQNLVEHALEVVPEDSEVDEALVDDPVGQ